MSGATCAAPFADCDTLATTGCETDTDSSAAHCGGCGLACSLGDLCSAGTCADSPYLQLDSGDQFTLVRRAGGLIGWGYSNSLMLGTGGNVTSPIRVGVLQGVTEVSGGEGFACHRVAGVVQCWGNNSYGQHGGGVSGTSNSAAPVSVVGLDDATMVRAGYRHACAIRADQSVWCWGQAGHGQLGYSATPASTEPAPVQVQGITDAIDLALGESFTCVLHGSDSSVSCFGEDDNGRLGYDPGVNQNQPLPVKVTGLTGVSRLAKSASTNRHMCAVLTTGSVVCWGHNQWGQLGNDSTSHSYAPASMRQVSGVKEVGAGYGHTCVVETDGDVWCAGADDVAQLGLPEDQGGARIAVQVDLGSEQGVSIGVGRRHTCALLDSGRVVCWGSNQYGQLGNGPTTGASTGVYPFVETLPAP